MAKTYEVVGTAPILDHEPGETFTATIPREQERYLIAIGGLAIVKKSKDAVLPAGEPVINRKAVEKITRDADGR